MNDDLQKRLRLVLLFCRISVFIVFAIWTYDKIVRPEHGIHMLKKFYHFPAGLAESVNMTFGLIELVLCVLLILGLYTRIVRGIFLFLATLAISMPMVIYGYYKAIFVEAHPTILYFTGFCLFACAFTIYYLRDYDTLYSLAKEDRKHQFGFYSLYCTLKFFLCR